MGEDPLAGIFIDCIREGEDTVIGDPDFLKGIGFPGRKAEAREVWWHLLEATVGAGELPQDGQEALLRRILRRGTLSTEILRALGIPPGSARRDERPVPRESVEEVFRVLAGCLQRGEILVV
jgi:hypothetical protein